MIEWENETNILYKTHRCTERDPQRRKEKDTHVGGRGAPGECKGWIMKKWFQAGVFTVVPKTHKKSCCFFTSATRVKIASTMTRWHKARGQTSE